MAKPILNIIKEKLCYDSKFLKPKEIMKQEEQLIQENKYYPKLIRLFMSNKYYLSVDENIRRECCKTKNSTIIEDVIELNEWMIKNKKHNDLVDIKKLNKLVENLSKSV